MHALLTLVGRAAATWSLILLLAIVNGALREGLLLPLLGNPAALILSGLLLMACIAIVAHVFAPGFGASSRRQYAAVGLLWLGLTLAFEFAFGVVRGKTWTEIFAAYTFANGNLWPLVLAFTLVAPALFGLRRGKHARDQHKSTGEV